MASFKKHKLKSGFSWEARGYAPSGKLCTQRFPNKKDAEKWASGIESGKISPDGTPVESEDHGSGASSVEQGLASDHRAVSGKKSATDATIKEVVAEYFDSHLAMTATLKREMNTVAYDLGSFKVSQINFKVVQSYIRLLEKTPIPPVHNKKGAKKRSAAKKSSAQEVKCYAASTIRKFFYALKVALSCHAREHGYALERDLFNSKEHKLPGHWENPRERRLKAGEEERLYAACDSRRKHGPSMKMLIRLALATGMRCQEMVLAEWKNISADGKSLKIPKEDSKTGKGRVVPLSTKAREVLEGLKALGPENSALLFPVLKADPPTASQAFCRLAKKAECAGLTLHDLRHEALSRMCELGTIGVMDLMKISGHTQLVTLERYVNLLPSDLADKLG